MGGRRNAQAVARLLREADRGQAKGPRITRSFRKQRIAPLLVRSRPIPSKKKT